MTRGDNILKSRVLKTRLILRKDGKTIFSFKCKKPKKSKYGELDIMMDAGNKLYFDQVVAGDYFRKYNFPKYKINGVSWHGYFESLNERFLNPPIVHFKENREKVAKEWHLGSVNKEEPIAFPLCSVYVPANMDVSELYPSQYTSSESIKYHIVDMDNNRDERVDIFVTPRGISAKKVISSSVGWVYRFIDIDIFNHKEGNAVPLHKNDMNKIEIIKDESGHDLLIRTIKNKSESSRFLNLIGNFSLLIHDPNDVYHKIVDRPQITLDKGKKFSEENIQIEYLKDRYEIEMKKE